MKIDYIKIADLKPYALNAKKHPKSQIAGIAESLKRFGWKQPVVVDSKNNIVIGHGRVEAAKLSKMETVPCVVADDLSPDEIKALRLIDNRIAETGWDVEMLALDLQSFALDLTPFNIEFDSLLPKTEVKDGLTDPDAVPDVQEKSKVQIGDMFALGNHRIICGDSTKAEIVEKLLGGVKPHLMVTDPPYGVEYDASWRNEATRANGEKIKGRATGKVLNDDKADWREAWALFPGDVAYVWHAGLFAGKVADSLTSCGFKLRSQIIWAKSNFAIGRGDYHWHHEPCWYAVREGKTGHYAGDRKQTTLWQIAKPSKSETGHSTQKPVECMRKPLENNSSVGQAIYEPFSGSGTTIIAAEQTGRVCYAVELNPSYVDVAIKRWQDFTGQLAKKL